MIDDHNTVDSIRKNIKKVNILLALIKKLYKLIIYSIFFFFFYFNIILSEKCIPMRLTDQICV